MLSIQAQEATVHGCERCVNVIPPITAPHPLLHEAELSKENHVDIIIQIYI